MQMYHIFCIHYSVEGYLGSFQLLAIINKAAMNIVEDVKRCSEFNSELKVKLRKRKNMIFSDWMTIEHMCEAS